MVDPQAPHTMAVDAHRIDLLKHRARKRRTVLVHAVRQLAADYSVRTIVAEPATLRRLRLGTRDLAIERTTLTIATSMLVATDKPPTIQAAYNEVVRRIPKLKRHVSVGARTGEISLIDRRRTVVLLAATLGLRHARGQEPPHP